MARITVKDLRAEAKSRLSDCRGGKQLSKLNKTELLDFLECINDIELAREYRTQEAARIAKRTKRVDEEVSINPRGRRRAAAPRPPTASQAATGAAAARARARPSAPAPSAAAAPKKKRRKIYNPSFDGEAPTDGGFQLHTDRTGRSYAAERGTRKSGPSGGGAGTYRQFVQEMLPRHRAKGMSNQDAMRAVAKDWRAHKQGGGGHRADSVARVADAIASSSAAAGLAQPELAAILEPAAAMAKGVGWAAKLF